MTDVPFDDEYFFYAEDTYFGWLTRLKGYDIKLSTKAICYHEHSAVRKKNVALDRYFTFIGERNRLLNIFLFFKRSTLIKIFPLILINIFVLIFLERKKSPFRLRSYFWILFHPRKILKKRNYIQKQRKISEDEFIGKMSCYIEESQRQNNFFDKFFSFLNKLFYCYCKLFKVKTIEFR